MVEEEVTGETVVDTAVTSKGVWEAVAMEVAAVVMVTVTREEWAEEAAR